MSQQKDSALSPIDSQLRDWGNTKINGVHLLAPNLITLYGLVFYFIGLSVYFFYALPGGIVALIGGLLDILDGMMARALKRKVKEPPEEWSDAQGVVSATVVEGGVAKRKILGRGIRSYGAKLWLEITYPGGTHLGQVLDPHADKLKMIPSLIVFSFLGFLNPWLVAVSVLPELVGTLMRRPFPLLRRWSHGKQAATWIGKTKVYIQWASIAACIPIHQEWLDMDSIIVPNGMLVLSIPFAIASVVSRWGKKKKEEVSDG